MEAPWVALAALLFTVVASAISSVVFLYSKMSADKTSLEEDLQVLRMSSYEEFKTLRKEIGEASSVARVEFGETISAIREKVTQVELWVRDQLTETRHTLVGGTDQKHMIAIEKIEETENRVRKLEIFNASKGYVPPD